MKVEPINVWQKNTAVFSLQSWFCSAKYVKLDCADKPAVYHIWPIYWLGNLIMVGTQHVMLGC